jgi:uncharacterized surface protein with fasciclin (FAS1) repeats
LKEDCAMRIAAFALGLAALVALAAAPIAYADCGKCSHDKPKDIVDTAVAAGSFKTLAAALKAADLVETLKGDGPFTVFAPTEGSEVKIRVDEGKVYLDKSQVTKADIHCKNGVIHVIDAVLLPE